MFFYIPRNHEKILLKNLPLHHFNRANPELVSCHGKVRPTWQIVLRQCHKPANCHPFFCSYLKLPTDKYPCLWLIKASDICTVTSYWHDLYTTEENDAQLMLSVIRWSEEAPNWLSEVSISNTGKKNCLPRKHSFPVWLWSVRHMLALAILCSLATFSQITRTMKENEPIGEPGRWRRNPICNPICTF